MWGEEEFEVLVTVIMKCTCNYKQQQLQWTVSPVTSCG